MYAVHDAHAGLSAARRNRVYVYWIDIARTASESFLIGGAKDAGRYGYFAHDIPS